MDFYRGIFNTALWILILAIIGCAPVKETRFAREDFFCSPATASAPVASGAEDLVVISGTAQFQAYKSTLSGLGAIATNPIRNAEVRLLNAAGLTEQCTQTNDLGGYSFKLIKSDEQRDYSIQVISRADNDKVKASILADKDTRAFYSIGQKFAVNSGSLSVEVPSLIAGVTGNVEGGAFNILEQVLKTNEYLRNNSTSSDCTLCQAFTVGPKVTIYWKKGFTPAAYSGMPDTGLSFFDIDGTLDSTPSLYILGGINGNVTTADTDHFDNSVIIHEYGHFLEAIYSRSDSPGGSHNGNALIDPRLAWSEGFANFLPSAVTGSTYYIDTIGSPAGTTRANIYVNLEAIDGHDSISNKTLIGEGVYREVSVSRALYDYLDLNSDQVDNPSGGTIAENSKLSFAYIWAAFTHPDYGIGNQKNHFRSVGQFNNSLKNVLTDLNLITELNNFEVARKAEFQTEDTSEYGRELKTLSTTKCTVNITPVNSITTTQGGEYPNWFLSADFYSYHHLGGDLKLNLSYTPLVSNNPPDLDLYLFVENYAVDNPKDLAGASDTFRNQESPTGNESINVSNLAPGYYMILVKAYTTSSNSGGAANYDLKIGDNYLCQ